MSAAPSIRVPSFLAAALVGMLGGVPRPVTAQASCERCHAELELLRQHVPTLADARRLFAPAELLGASAHADQTCVSCHDGYEGRFPHPEGAETATCASCHEAATDAWSDGIHAAEGDADCASCHGVHDVLPVARLREGPGRERLVRACASCHFEPRLPAGDPHADTTSCVGCHEPHRTLPPSDPASAVHGGHQAQTCGACHEDVSTPWVADVHGTAVAGAVPVSPGEPAPPACSGCHGAHGMVPTAAPGFTGLATERCASCHEAYAETFADSYHGQAVRLGSEAVAGCHDCHTAHSVQPASDPRSSVAPERLVATCRSCHPDANASFTRFQPHADPHDPDRFPVVAWSYRLMTALLVGVFTVFGAHTLLWLVRLTWDALRRPDPTPTRDGR